MKNGTLTQSELVARVSGLVAANLLLKQRRGRSLADRLRRAPGCAGDILPAANEAQPAAPSAERAAVNASICHSVDLFLLACEPWPGAAGLGDGATATDAGPEVSAGWTP